ncbi:MAG: energy transducer TonB [Deltaproteobacteria bacterium]|nr:energy transducer TonB [Deltaproteobacteria bacterium]
MALGFSLGCHATLLLALLLLSARRAPLGSERPIVVAVLGDDGAGVDGAPGEAAVSDATAASATAAEPAEPRPQRSHVSVARRSRSAVRAPQVAAAPSRSAATDADATTARAANGATAAVGGGVDDTATGDGGATRDARAGAGRGGGDLRPWCTICPIPDYPARARREGWQGTVDVELHVDRDGAVEQASIGRSSGFAVLDAAAVTVARRSRFRVADALHGQLRYRFVLDGPTDRPL